MSSFVRLSLEQGSLAVANLVPMWCCRRLRTAAALLLAACAAAIGPTGFAGAATITQTFPITITGSNTQGFTWNQFDPALGTLTGITFSMSGTVSGSFTVTNTSEDDTVQLSNPADRLRMVFSGTGTKPTNQLTSQLPLLLSPSMSGTGFTLGVSGTQLFTLDPASQVFSPLSSELFAVSNYFIGLSTVSSIANQSFTITTSGGVTMTDLAALQSQGVAALVYTYSAIVPEIDPAGTGSMVALVVGVLAILERRRWLAAG